MMNVKLSKNQVRTNQVHYMIRLQILVQ